MATPSLSPKLLRIPKWFNMMEWLDLLQGPKDPPFKSNTTFQREGKRFWQLVSTTGVLTGISILADVSHVTQDFALSPITRYCIGGLATFAVAYCLGISKLFGINISVRQGFFTFGFLILPWIPLFSLVIFLGARLSIGFLIACYAFPLYIIWSIAKGISIITNTNRIRAFGSVSMLIGIIAGFATYAFLCT